MPRHLRVIRVLVRSVPAALLALALLSLAGCSADTPPAGSAKTLVFSAIPDQDETRLRQKFQPVAEYLSGTLGVPVSYHHCTSYEDAVEQFKNGDVQLAWFGGLTGVQARVAVPGARAILQGKEDLVFYSYFIAHRDTGLERSDEFPAGLAGKTFTFGSRSSTSGRLMPEHFIRMHTGKAPPEFFGHPNNFAENHDQTLELVNAGQVQAGALSYTVYESRVKEGRIDPDVCRVIWQTPAYADYNFTAHPELDTAFGAGFTDRLQQAFLDMKDPALLDAFGRSALVAASNDDFAMIEQLARDLDFVR